MSTTKPVSIRIETTVNAPIEKVWDCWNNPEHVTQWNQAAPEWHCPSGRNDLRAGGKFSYRMEAKDGSFGFDFSGVYDEVKPMTYIQYHLDDNRKVEIHFVPTQKGIRITEDFEAENQNSLELQKTGWQAILDSFRKYVEK